MNLINTSGAAFPNHRHRVGATLILLLHDVHNRCGICAWRGLKHRRAQEAFRRRRQEEIRRENAEDDQCGRQAGLPETYAPHSTECRSREQAKDEIAESEGYDTEQLICHIRGKRHEREGEHERD